ncbi:MAG: hypothetical protein LBQ83_06980 [Candidatus Margulisbacteria bacterium]|jgi:hypothetical protein|nr:hypothetical protein [Candidatus Margulisiibacteriota bacterium]
MFLKHKVYSFEEKTLFVMRTLLNRQLQQLAFAELPQPRREQEFARLESLFQKCADLAQLIATLKAGDLPASEKTDAINKLLDGLRRLGVRWTVMHLLPWQARP